MTRPEQPDLEARRAVEALLPRLDDQAGPAEPMSAAAQAALVQAALASTTPPVLWTRRGWLLGSTAVVAAGVTGYLVNRRRAPTPERVVTSAPPPSAPAKATAPVSAATAPGTDSVPSAHPTSAASEPPASESRAAPSRKKQSSSREPADLLHLANERRRQQRFPEALRLYQQILVGHPLSEEAYVAEVAAGSLLHDRLRSPQAALRLYQRALRERPSGVLSEEARLGVCEVQRTLGDAAAERAALKEFLARHGDSPARARLAARLTQLEGK